MVNICGCLVHCMPEKVDSVVAAIDAIAGCDVHTHEDGRIVMTVEDTGAVCASDQIMAVHQIPGVINVTLTYHHFEDINEAESASPTQL